MQLNLDLVQKHKVSNEQQNENIEDSIKSYSENFGSKNNNYGNTNYSEIQKKKNKNEVLDSDNNVTFIKKNLNLKQIYKSILTDIKKLMDNLGERIFNQKELITDNTACSSIGQSCIIFKAFGVLLRDYQKVKKNSISDVLGYEVPEFNRNKILLKSEMYAMVLAAEIDVSNPDADLV